MGAMISKQATAASFTDFVAATERRLRQALTAAYGPEVGRDAAAEAFAYGWEHWERIGAMANPSGYLYRVGRDRARRLVRRPVVLPSVQPAQERWVEPGLPAALAQISTKQRTVVALLYGYQWSMSEVAELLGISKTTVQNHAERGLRRLRKTLGVDV